VKLVTSATIERRRAKMNISRAGTAQSTHRRIQPRNRVLMTNDQPDHDGSLKWHEGISGCQWLVLAVASLGWVFDFF